jgi:hypothetical protein
MHARERLIQDAPLQRFEVQYNVGQLRHGRNCGMGGPPCPATAASGQPRQPDLLDAVMPGFVWLEWRAAIGGHVTVPRVRN